MIKHRSKKGSKRWKCLAWMMALAVCLGGCAGSGRQNTAEHPSSQETVSEEESPSVQETAAGQEGASAGGIVFEGHDMEGNAVSSDIFSSSKLTMVNVWATYCNPCLKEMPGLGELAHAYDEGEFQIIGIISDVQENSGEEMIHLAADLIERTGADYPHLLLNESLYYALLTEVSAVPTTFFIDENGKLLDTVIGSMDKSQWEELIHGFLGK